jgi:hypothetical protein
MPGGLLQLVATGLDNIFLTSTPSITLFKLTYRRHTNFSVTQRTKQILNIYEFGQNGQYELEKEGDIIHNIYFNINISDFNLQYPLPTYENIINLLNKYNLHVNIDSNKNITIDYYNNTIIPQILSEISQYVIKFNNSNIIIDNQHDFFKNYDYTNKNINNLLQDNYNYYLLKNINDNIELNILFLILTSYLKDINNTNNKIYKINDIYAQILNDILNKLTYDIIGYDTNKLENTYYDSIKLLYIINNLSQNNRKYYNYDFKNLLINIIENQTLPVLQLSNYKTLENYITLQNYINNINPTQINEQYIDNLLFILKKNMYYNNEIIYNVIINTILKYTHNTSHFIFGIYKTFTNNISDTTYFTSTMNSINDNLLSIFTNYNNINDIYLVQNILKSINLFNMNTSSIFNTLIFNDYFNDLSLWNNLEINSSIINDILSNLYFDLDSNTIVNITNYFDNITNTFKKRLDGDINYIDIKKNIYNSYLNKYDFNTYLLNFIPLLVINNLANEIFTEFSTDTYINSNIDSSLYEYRDLNEITNFNNYNQINLYNNQIIKNDLYKQILCNIILQLNNTSTDFILNNYKFLSTFNDLYTNNDRTSLMFLCRPENLCTFTVNGKNIKLPPINYISEIFRINIMKNIDSQYYDYVYNKLNDILNRYDKFKNTINLTNNIYSYNSYKLNGMTFTNIENNFIQKLNVIEYIHAQSSIYAYCYNMFIQNYNKLFNTTLISADFYNNIGSHYLNTYEFIKMSLINQNLNYFDNQSFVSLKNYYSYELNNNIIYYYDENNNINYPVIDNGFDYYSIGDSIQINSNVITLNTINYTSISNQSYLPTIINLNNNKNSIQNLQNLTYIDIKYLYTQLKLFYNIETDNINTSQHFINSPYDTNLFKLFNKIDYNDISITNLINLINNNTNNLSIPEKNILPFILNDIEKKYNLLNDEINNIKSIINKYQQQINQFDTQYIYSQQNYNYIKSLNYDKNKFNNFIDIFFNEIIQNILTDRYILSLYNNYDNLSDLINYMINKIIQLSDYNFLYDYINLNIQTYSENLINNLNNDKNLYLQRILSITTLTDDTKILNSNTEYINFNENIPYIDYLYVNKSAFIDKTDILYHGSKLDMLIRNIIEQNPVKTCWVPELGYYILENISLHFDQLLIDEYDSNLLSLLRKLTIPYDQNRGLDKLIGNSLNLITYDTSGKGNLHLYIPLNFYFCKNAAISLSMINLLYTKGTIQFKLRNIEDLLIYDKNAVFIKKPIIKCNMLVKYIFLEEEERKKIASSRLEFLIEKYKKSGTFFYNKTDLLNNNTFNNVKLISRLRMTDPTKYILWRLRVKYQDNDVNNYLWNINGYTSYNNQKIKTISYIKIYFNGKIREQGQSQLFNLINPYGRYLGSLNDDEYIYCFSLYPLIYQPSGSANLSQIEDIMIEYTLEPEFAKLINDNNLIIETDYWTCSYNILRMISGLCAPLFYN